jgi:hypothetical protein
VKGLAQAEWLRFRNRRILLLIIIAVPLLATFFFFASYTSNTYVLPTFDPEEVRARVIAEGWFAGLPPDEVEAAIVQEIELERVNYEQSLEQLAITRARYAFPQSIVILLGNVTFMFVALVLLTAMSIGDEFGWGTVKTALLASSRRRLLMFVRLVALTLVAAGMLAMLVLLGAILPAVLTLAGTPQPNTQPIDPVGLIALLFGQLLISTMVITFSALMTLLIRSGSLTLVACLAYAIVETAVVGLLTQLEAFQYQGANEWLLDALPLRGTFALIGVAAQATGGLPTYAGEIIDRDLGAARVPFVAIALWAGLFATLAFRRFSWMDIVE